MIQSNCECDILEIGYTVGWIHFLLNKFHSKM